MYFEEKTQMQKVKEYLAQGKLHDRVPTRAVAILQCVLWLSLYAFGGWVFLALFLASLCSQAFGRLLLLVMLAVTLGIIAIAGGEYVIAFILFLVATGILEHIEGRTWFKRRSSA
jgi:hypothetical protein